MAAGDLAVARLAAGETADLPDRELLLEMKPSVARRIERAAVSAAPTFVRRGSRRQPIPALGGKTPRQAARSRAGRKDLDLLLRHIEHGESAQPEGSRFDVSAIRDELGL